jgi:NAD(P)-dependent dehydrogenase (short-subunit alcohol dehydrogenase family)
VRQPASGGTARTFAREGQGGDRQRALVNNDGISGSAEQDFYSTEAWHRIIAVNAIGMFFDITHDPGQDCQWRRIDCQSFVDCRHHRQWARAHGLQCVEGGGAAGGKSVAVQHAKEKVRVNSVHPGVMPPIRTSGRAADPAVRADRMRFIPMPRAGGVDEMAYATLFLASDESS